VSAADRSYRTDCVAVIVTYNSAARIERMIGSLRAAARGLRLRCIVVDNASSDGTVAVARHCHDVTVIASPRNLGYSGAINLARAHAGDYAALLVVNPDIEFEPGAIGALRDALAHPPVGVAVPMLLDDRGEVFPTLRREPTILRALGDALLGARWNWRPGWLSEMVWSPRAYAVERDTDWATGAAMLISAECDARVGAWDEERFFLYSEETDYFRRARRSGLRIRYVPAARVHHAEGGSGRSPALAALLAVNRVRYYEKYHRRRYASCFRVVVALSCALRLADPGQRLAFKAVCRRRYWRHLPGGIV